MENEKKRLPTEKEVLENVERIKKIENPAEAVIALSEQVSILARILGAFYVELRNFEENSYQATVQNSLETNACIHALTKRGLLTPAELDAAFKEVSEAVRNEQEQKLNQSKEESNERKETRDEAGPGVQGAGTELRGDTEKA